MSQHLHLSEYKNNFVLNKTEAASKQFTDMSHDFSMCFLYWQNWKLAHWVSTLSVLRDWERLQSWAGKSLTVMSAKRNKHSQAVRDGCSHLALSWHLNSRRKGAVLYTLECAVWDSEPVAEQGLEWTSLSKRKVQDIAEPSLLEVIGRRKGRDKPGPGLEATALTHIRKIRVWTKELFKQCGWWRYGQHLEVSGKQVP